MIGLPGTGLGGIFYILLVAWMTVRELWLLARSASSCWRWKRIAKLVVLSVSIVAALWFEGWSIQRFIDTMWAHNLLTDEAVAMHRRFAYAITPMMTIVPFVVLAALMIALHTFRLVLRQRQKTTARPLLAPAGVDIPTPPSR